MSWWLTCLKQAVHHELNFLKAHDTEGQRMVRNDLNINNLTYPPAPAAAIAGEAPRDSEASSAACSPSLAGSSRADGASHS